MTISIPYPAYPPCRPPLLCGGGIYDGSLQIVSTAGRSAPCAASPAAFSWCPRRLCLSPPGPPRPSCGLSPNFCACGGSTISLTPGGIFLCPNFYACGRYTISLTPGGVFLCISWRSAVLLPCPRTLCSRQQVLHVPLLLSTSTRVISCPWLPPVLHYCISESFCPSSVTGTPPPDLLPPLTPSCGLLHLPVRPHHPPPPT